MCVLLDKRQLHINDMKRWEFREEMVVERRRRRALLTQLGEEMRGSPGDERRLTGNGLVRALQSPETNMLECPSLKPHRLSRQS